VDETNCNKPSSKSVYFPELRYSYFTCGNANTFDSWFRSPADAGSGEVTHQLTELVDLMQKYTKTISETLEENWFEAKKASSCSPASACNCVDCEPHPPEWTAVPDPPAPPAPGPTPPPKSTPDINFAGATYKTRPGTSTTSKDATTDQCLANIVTSSFTRIAAKESDPTRVGYEYYGSQSLGNYVQWPGMEDCKDYDPRYRPWYAAAASGPKDVVLVIDTSGSMAGDLNDMAKNAAKMVINTLTAVDYVTIVKYSSAAQAYSSTLVEATDANKDLLKAWIDENIGASGTTNFRAAFEKAWQVVDATTASSNCNRIMLFLSDGEPNEWDGSDTEGVKAKAASYDPPMHLLTYGLGEGAKADVLKDIACGGKGVYYSVTKDTISDKMASYFQVLAPMLNPCKLRWTKYNDYYTGKELLGACLASFELESSGAKTSCNGGLSGLGERGDCRVPKLIGVGCIDMNLVVDLPTLESHAGYNDFWAKVQSDMKACPRNTLTEAQMETLRNASGGHSSMCNSVHHNHTDCHDGEDCEDEGEVIGAVIGAIVPVVIVGFVIFAIVRFVRARMAAKAAATPPAALPAAQSQQQIQMQHQASVPVCQGAVVSAYPQATAGYPQATAGYPQAPSWSVGEAGGPVQGDTVWHDGQQCTVQYVNSKGLLDLRNQGGAVFYGVAKVELSPPGPTAGYPQAAQPPVMMGQVVS
jgi:uncharacterized protein YegL